MNANVKYICEVVEEIKENITDNEYKNCYGYLNGIECKKAETDEDLEEVVDS